MYQVIINFYTPGNTDNFDFCEFRTYSEVTCKLKRDINSTRSFVYVRKVLKDMIGKFSLVMSTSYTFNHWHSVDNSTENFLKQLWR